MFQMFFCIQPYTMGGQWYSYDWNPLELIPITTNMRFSDFVCFPELRNRKVFHDGLSCLIGLFYHQCKKKSSISMLRFATRSMLGYIVYAVVELNLSPVATYHERC